MDTSEGLKDVDWNAPHRPRNTAGDSETILVLAPTGRDALLAKTVLEEAALHATVCTDLQDLCAHIEKGELATFEIGVILLAEESLIAGREQDLVRILERQPPWSDIPIVLLTSPGVSDVVALRALEMFGSSGNVTLLERPLKAITLVSAMQVALRSRRRQYQIRDLLRERESALSVISAARQQSEDANRMKDQFLATLSHELRTPLNAILGWAQILSENLDTGNGATDSLQQGLEVIERNAKVQAQLIEDLLDISRIISGKLLLEQKLVDPSKIVMAAADAIAPQAEAKGVILELKIGAPVPRIIGDAARLQQIVWNLLSNAVKFTPENGNIFLGVQREGRDVTIVVRDTGAGMSPLFLPVAFERFRQADATATRKQGGLGLGLSIVRHLTELHKGSVEAWSEGEGKGATFTIRIPIANPGAATDANEFRTPEDAKSSAQNILLDGLRILVVDNEPDARDLVRRLLVEARAEVEVADSAAQAMRIAARYKPDVLISDIGMPDEDGYDLIRKIRNLPNEVARVPAIALTAYASMEDEQKAKQAGYQYHLAKPVNPKELRAVVAKLM